MATVRVSYNIEYTDPSSLTTVVAHKTTSLSQSLSHGLMRLEGALTSGQTVVLYDPVNDGLGTFSDFDFLCFTAITGNIDLELTCNEGNANETVQLFRVVPGCPFILGADDSAYGAVGAQGLDGSADVIDKIRIKDASAATNAYQLLLGT